MLNIILIPEVLCHESVIHTVYFLSFRERPRLNSSTVDFNKLRQLPDGFFGREYVRGMDINVSLFAVLLRFKRWVVRVCMQS